MPEIRISVTETLDSIIEKISKGLGVSKTEYLKSLILNDLRNKGKLK